MEMFHQKQEIEKKYSHLSRNDLLWLLVLQDRPVDKPVRQRGSMISATDVADFKEKTFYKSTHDIIDNFTLASLQKAFNIKGGKLHKEDWIRLVGEAICNSC